MSRIDKLEARLDGVGHLLADRYIVVPPYQRAYSWTDEQITDLLRDISDAIRSKDSEYFLGTIVLTKNNEGSHFVIDGQQRLATVSILVCAIRNYFHTVGDKERGDLLHQGYLAKKDLRELTETAHLKLIAADNGFYESVILSKPLSAPTTRKSTGFFLNGSTICARRQKSSLWRLMTRRQPTRFLRFLMIAGWSFPSRIF